ALFYMMLQGKYLVPVSTINIIIEEMRVCHPIEQDCALAQLKSILSKHNISDEAGAEIVKSLKADDIFNVAHNARSGVLRSDYMRQKYYKEKFSLVEPVTLYLGVDRYDKNAVCQYVPI